MSLAPGFFGVQHRENVVFIGIIIGRGRHPDSKTLLKQLGAQMNSLDSDTSYLLLDFLDILDSDQPPGKYLPA